MIDNNIKRIRILEETARALYREWFIEFRFTSQRHASSQSREIPDRFRVRNLSEIATVNHRQVDTRRAPADIQYIDISSVSPGVIQPPTSYRFEDAPGRARRIVSHGDVLWSCVRPNRRSHAIVMHPAEHTIASTGFAVLSATRVPYTFLYCATTTDQFVSYLTNHATGAAYPAVTAATFANAEIVVPPDDLLARFAEVTVPMAELIHNLHCQNAKLRATRDLLLPRLLSGQLTLAEAVA